MTDFQKKLNEYLPKFEVIENKILPKYVVLFADKNFFYWHDTRTGETNEFPKSDILETIHETKDR